MEAPKYCLEAVAIWGKVKIKKGGHVKAFCAYGATEYGTDSEAVKTADEIACFQISLARMYTAIAIVTAKARLN